MNVNSIELYIASLDMLHSRLFKETATALEQQQRSIDLAWPVDLVSCSVLLASCIVFYLAYMVIWLSRYLVI